MSKQLTAVASSQACPAPDSIVGGQWQSDDGIFVNFECHPDGRLTGRIRFAYDGPVYRPHEFTGTWLFRPDGTHGFVGSVRAMHPGAPVTVWCGEVNEAEGLLTTTWLSATGTADCRVDAVPTSGAVFRRPRIRSRRLG